MYCTTTNKKIELYQGDSLNLEFTVEDEEGSAVNLTNYNIRFVVFNTSLSKDSVNPSEAQITDAVNGIATVYLKPADTASLRQKYKYTYDAEIYDGSGNVYTFLQGIFWIV